MDRTTRTRIVTRLALIVLGVGVGIALLAAAELGLRFAGVAEGGPRHDPFAGFSHQIPLFERTTRADGTAVMRISREGRPAGDPIATEPLREFLAEKPPGLFRIFIVGDSSAAGAPYTPLEGFSGWLAQRLAAELPDVPTEVVNAAVSGYGSRRALIVAQELAAYQPDLLIVYVGHNELAERQFYAHLLNLDPRLFRVWEWFAGLRLYRLLSPGAGTGTPKLDPNAGRAAMDMFAVMTERAGGSHYADDRERAYTEMLYEYNLEGMVDAMRAAGATVLLATISQNFSDWAPAASLHRPDLAETDRGKWDAHLAAGKAAADRGDCTAALASWRQAVAIDDRYADLWYRIATCERSLGMDDDARRDFRLASDLDAVPHGAPTSRNDIVRAVAARRGTLLTDVDAALTRASPGGLVGDDLFTDFVHPNLRAHQLIAGALATTLRDAGIPAAAARWRTEAWHDPDAEAILASQPRLRVREHLVRSFACVLARRDDCALREARAAAALDGTDPVVALHLANLERNSGQAGTSGPRVP